MQKLIFSSALLVLLGTAASAGNVTISTEMATPYQSLHEKIANAIYAEMPSFFSRSCEEGNDDSYRCGEIPVGTIESDSQKNLFSVTIPAKKFNQQGFKGTFPATNFEVSVSRKQYGGADIKEKLIGKEEALKSSSYMGRDIYVTLNSKNNKMGGVACVYVPGVKTKVESVTSSFTAKKKLWFLTSKTKITTTIDVGESSFDAIKTCLAFQVVPKSDPKTKTLSYDYSLVAMSKPQFLNLKRSPIKVEVKVKGANWLGSIVNLFAKSTISKQVKAAIMKQVSKQVDNLYDSDALDGKWFSKLINAKNIKMVDSVSAQLAKALSTKYTPDMEEISASYGKVCGKVQAATLKEFKKAVTIGQATAAQLQKLTTKFDEFCGSFEDLQVSAFNKTKEGTDAGCYKNAVRVTDMDPILLPRLSKEAFKCEFVHRLSTKVDSHFKELGQCMLDQWKYKFSESCTDEIVGVMKYGASL